MSKSEQTKDAPVFLCAVCNRIYRHPGDCPTCKQPLVPVLVTENNTTDADV